MGFNPENQLGNQVEWAVMLLWSINIKYYIRKFLVKAGVKFGVRVQFIQFQGVFIGLQCRCLSWNILLLN